MLSSRKPQKRIRRASENFDSEDIVRAESQRRLHARCEQAWKRLVEPPDEDESWSVIEEHLLAEREDPDRRWKYFSK